MHSPRPLKTRIKLPGVLSPHGHWENGSLKGRFYEAPVAQAQSDVKQGAEFDFAGDRCSPCNIIPRRHLDHKIAITFLPASLI